ncbi:hypothetical protein AR158_c778R [Paramecium bursaria Chlorella virus AR158]|uniref:hypothetical protein n=1 Tax=Paramecium bursaria Chlorella virus AR158 TaxID=380598 RepID=UPI00015AA8D7|nr:hypothetical protein AR158_c778R [Paramecium bursaria Chlorella virus AR158]ABU44323.1 hypothetical protein AR158_c778R [Paramecium bursaria Chlorella virus AR158]
MSCFSRKQKNACSSFFRDKRRYSSGSHERQYCFPLARCVLTGHGTPSYPEHIGLTTSIALSGLHSEHHSAFCPGSPNFDCFPHGHFLDATLIASPGLQFLHHVGVLSPGIP